MGPFKRSAASQPERPAVPPGRRRPGQITSETPAPQRPAAFSYYTQRSDRSDNTGRLDASAQAAAARDQAGPLRATGKRRAAAIGLVAVAVLAVCNLFLSTTPRVQLSQDKAGSYFLQDAASYRQAAQRELSSSVLNYNKLTVDSNGVRTRLLADYPEIRSVDFDAPFLGMTPVLRIEPYEPSFILSTANGSAFLLDATGRALATPSQISDMDSLNVPTIADKSGLEITIGKRALPVSTVTFAQTVVKALEAKQVVISSLTLPSGGYELDVAISGTPYFVKFNILGDASGQAGTYLAVRQRLATEKVTPASYVDVRVPERAYYK